MEVAALVRTRAQEEVLIAKQDIEAHWNHIHSCPQAGTRDQGVPSFHEAADVGKSEQKVNRADGRRIQNHERMAATSITLMETHLWTLFSLRQQEFRRHGISHRTVG